MIGVVRAYAEAMWGGHEGAVAVTASTSAAAAQLGGGARTLHQLLRANKRPSADGDDAFEPAASKNDIEPLRLVVLDEVSMTDADMYGALVDALRAFQLDKK